MRSKPTTAKLKYGRSLLVAAAVLVAACAGETTAPAARISAPVEAAKALSGAVDGVYTFHVDPRRDQTLRFGDSYLELPANSICDNDRSSYGPEYWNSPCATETQSLNITVIVRNSKTNNPSVDFAPAMRFSPTKAVQLTIDVTNATTLSNMTTMLYCGPFYKTCIDESTTDRSLVTSLDRRQNTVSRRIKHFSGYVVAE